MNEEYTQVNPEYDPQLPPAVETPKLDGTIEDIEFKASEEALAAADAALVDIASRSFSGRNAGLGKMINCPVCHRRHRRTDVAPREHIDENGKKTVTLETLITECKQQFKQMWVDEDLETGELSIQYAQVPLPGQKGTPKGIVGARYFAKKRKHRHPSKTGLQILELTRRIFPTINRERFSADDAAMLEARRIAINSLRKKRRGQAAVSRRQQKLSRKVNRGR